MDAYDEGVVFMVIVVVVFSGAFSVGNVRGVLFCLFLLIRSLRSRILLSSRSRRRYWLERALWVTRDGSISRTAFYSSMVSLL